ncbi:MAG: SsrA-binding protein SmpB [Candidatus Pacebacteria bacterium]|nr:SsrA-binding protein SmpB [Candidatus Paceibacterota bacterium]NUQ57042.1 SsrA-binding protein SmpB [Candidatus Paceibacter sp.]
MSALLENKKAYFDYEIMEKFQAGLELLGWEVKSLRNKQGSLAGSRVIIRGGEAFLVGASVSPYQPKNIASGSAKAGEENRTIKLLLTKKELNYLAGKAEEKGLTLIPLKIFTLGKKLKLELALVRGKKKFEKREKIKKRETERNVRRLMKE